MLLHHPPQQQTTLTPPLTTVHLNIVHSRILLRTVDLPLRLELAAQTAASGTELNLTDLQVKVTSQDVGQMNDKIKNW